MKEHKLNSEYEFLQGYYLDNPVVSDNLIKYFENSKNKVQGSISNNQIDKKLKDSTARKMFRNV